MSDEKGNSDGEKTDDEIFSEVERGVRLRRWRRRCTRDARMWCTRVCWARAHRRPPPKQDGRPGELNGSGGGGGVGWVVGGRAVARTIGRPPRTTSHHAHTRTPRTHGTGQRAKIDHIVSHSLSLSRSVSVSLALYLAATRTYYVCVCVRVSTERVRAT